MLVSDCERKLIATDPERNKRQEGNSIARK